MAEKKVDNVKINVGFSEEQKLKELESGERLSVLMGKLAKGVKDLIVHLADNVRHVTAAERTAWNGKAAGNHTHDAASSAVNGFMSAADKTKLDGIATGANKYTHPTTAGNKHIPSGGASGQILRWSADGTAEWGADNNTTYGNMSGASASAAGKAGLVPAPAAGAQAKYLRGDGTWQTPPDTNTTYSAATQSANGLMSAADKKKLDGIAASANNYTHPATAGNKHIPAGGSSGQILRWSSDGTAEWGADNNTTYGNMSGASASAAGKAGLVPAPAAGAQAKYLRGDGTWQIPDSLISALVTGTFLNGNKGVNVLINSTAAANSYVMLAKLNSTNGYFTLGVWQNKFILQYTAKSTVDAGTNGVTHSVTLLDESGGSTFPGIVAANKLKLTDGITSWNVMQLFDDGDTVNNGGNLVIQGGGNTYIGSGEAPQNLYNAHIAGTLASGEGFSKTAEQTYIASDSHIYFETNCQTIANRKVFFLSNAGEFAPGLNNGGNLGTSALKWNNAYVTTFHGALDGNAGTATKLATQRNIDGIAFDGSGNVTHYVQVSGAGATAAKTTTKSGFTVAQGAELIAKFVYTNTAAVPTLNVNSTGAKEIRYKGAALPDPGYLDNQRYHHLFFDGTYWELVGDYDAPKIVISDSATGVTNYAFPVPYTGEAYMNLVKGSKVCSSIPLSVIKSAGSIGVVPL